MNKRNNRNNRSGLHKEKMTMIAAAVFVLSALTLTGVYMASNDEAGQEENQIDFAKLEEQSQTKETKQQSTKELNLAQNEEKTDTAQANTKVAGNDKQKLLDEARYINENTQKILEQQKAQAQALVTVQDEVTEAEAIVAEEEKEQEASVVTEHPVFEEGETLQWPIVGEVLLNYSMDKAVYHETLQQYRYNPSIVIAAEEGSVITSAADAVIKEVGSNPQLGNMVVFDLGNGYELTYGQLQDIAVIEGQVVQAGDIVGYVAAPTIYYSEEGSNVYFKLTKDGVAVDPLGMME
ncbi:MAG: M23 family metallopeptidase [Lachnospiraceae bacterium]|nr:M23 family metallopeptidase [Lachnospiraceae bacterium]